jgi:hypothetical protein
MHRQGRLWRRRTRDLCGEPGVHFRKFGKFHRAYPRLRANDGLLSPYGRGTTLIIDRWHGGHRS